MTGECRSLQSSKDSTLPSMPRQRRPRAFRIATFIGDLRLKLFEEFCWESFDLLSDPLNGGPSDPREL